MHEFSLINELVEGLPKGEEIVGVGDDAAVFKVDDGYLLMTTDSMVEDVHFKTSYFSGADLGWKLAAVNAVSYTHLTLPTI